MDINTVWDIPSKTEIIKRYKELGGEVISLAPMLINQHHATTLIKQKFARMRPITTPSSGWQACNDKTVNIISLHESKRYVRKL